MEFVASLARPRRRLQPEGPEQHWRQRPVLLLRFELSISAKCAGAAQQRRTEAEPRGSSRGSAPQADPKPSWHLGAMVGPQSIQSISGLSQRLAAAAFIFWRLR